MENQDKLLIRTARGDDAAALYRAEWQTSHVPGLLISAPDELCEQAFHDKILWLREAGCYLVAQAAAMPVGHALLEPLPLRAMAHVFSLTIVVHPGHTGGGVGKALMTALMQWAASDPRVEKIELRVRESNVAARRLYEKFGFVQEGRFEKRIRLPDGTCLADLSMARWA